MPKHRGTRAERRQRSKARDAQVCPKARTETRHKADRGRSSTPPWQPSPRDTRNRRAGTAPVGAFHGAKAMPLRLALRALASCFFTPSFLWHLGGGRLFRHPSIRPISKLSKLAERFPTPTQQAPALVSPKKSANSR